LLSDFALLYLLIAIIPLILKQVLHLILTFIAVGSFIVVVVILIVSAIHVLLPKKISHYF
jgi:hypothetical protein